ncbi:nucleotidyltransferase family protein [Caenispirillum salinarum]|uniref:nucleotidyltransferase family protein n=1 Tax=Caenispirillum salinarum TaxID=859058 RepID=UPI00384DED71
MTLPLDLAARAKASRERIRGEILSWLREALPAADKGSRVARMVVFGSVARGDFHGLSDVDLAVIGEGVRPGDLDTAALLPLERPVDVIYLDPARDPHMMAEIDRDGVTVWHRPT